MIKVVNGRRYNTKTAEKLATYGNGLSVTDFRHYDESLYKTKKGSFFLAGEGGPMTKYSQPCGDMTGGGENIIPLTEQEALSWCEDRDEVEVINDHLADLVEDA
jgi:hypothetical protein